MDKMPEPKTNGEKEGDGLVMAENAHGGGHTRKSGPENRPLEFRTENIGQWAARQEGLFAEQNRKDAEAKAKREQKIKRARIGVWIGCGVLVVLALVSAVVVMLPEPLPPLPENIVLGSEGAAEISKQAQDVLEDFFRKHNIDASAPTPEENREAFGAVTDYFDRRANQTDELAKKIDLTLVEMSFYAYKGEPEIVIEVSRDIGLDSMSQTQLEQFLGMLIDASFGVGDIDGMNYYVGLLDDITSSDEDEEEREEYP